jgi:ATP-dependent DNA ligase
VTQIDPSYEIPKSIRMDVWFKPEQVVEVDCQEFSRSPLYEWGFVQGYGGISLRFPVFKRMRDDKSI